MYSYDRRYNTLVWAHSVQLYMVILMLLSKNI